MSLLTLTDVQKSYGNQDVLQGVSFFVAPGRKTGLVGPNGAGKTTILRLITRSETPDGGRVSLQPNTRVALLSQEPLVGDARSVLDAAQRPSAELQEVWAELTALEAAELHDEESLHKYDALHHRYQDLGGYDCENRAKEILGGLGFPEAAWDKPVSVLSGGERTRLALVQILVLQPDLLLLDEPTNHVDWEACEWLQEYMRRYPGAALIVSHDRFFLDEVAEEIVELERGRAKTYAGNYAAYVKKKAAEQEQAEENYRRQQEEIAREEAIIQRLRSHRKFNSMHSREKKLERMQDELGDKPREDRRGLKIHQKEIVNTGREALSVRGLEQGFDARRLFAGLNFSLERGERLAIIGPNGAGKTTLLKTIAGLLPARAGNVNFGFRAKPAYFAQDLSSLDPEATVWDTIWDTGELDLTHSMQALHQFLFAGDAIEKQVGDLSGGERTRLALCKLLVTKPNLLLLDEPTNHLDIASREAVERALQHYPGAVIVVSHDRYFLEAVATRLLEIRPECHRFYDGSYRRYRETLKKPASNTQPPKKPVQNTQAPASKSRAVSPSKRLPKLEAEIAQAEARVKEITALLADAATWSNGTDANALSAEYDALHAKLEALMAEWEEISELVPTK